MNCVNKEIGESIALYEFNLLGLDEAQRFESHLVECNYCASDFYRMQPVWTALREKPDLILNPERYMVGRQSLLQMLISKPAMAIASASFLLLMMVGVRQDDVQTSQTKLARLAAIVPDRGVEVRVRGGVEREEEAPFVHVYEMGLMNLSQAERRIGQTIRVDQEKVSRGVDYLNEALKIAMEMDNETHLGECYLYLGKAHLMRGDAAQARSYLEEVLKLNQSGTPLMKLKRQASQLMEKMKQITGR